MAGGVGRVSLGMLQTLGLLAIAAADYGDPRKGGCAAGDMPAKFPFGGCMCMPKCNAGKCPAAPGGATAIPTCEFSSTGKPPPDYCGLRCKNGETCPTGTSCEMPTGICAFPYPMSEPEDDLEAYALDEQLVTAYSALEPQAEVAEDECTDLLHVQCNSVKNKVPVVTAALPTGESVELGLSPADKEQFEHLVGHGLRGSAAVKWVTAEFTKRALDVVLHGLAPGDENATETAIMGSFADPKFNRGNTGYVGPDYDAIMEVLHGAETGDSNIREVWALMYALTKNSWETPFGEALNSISAADMGKLGLNATAVLSRRAAINVTEGAPKSFDKYSNGIGDWSYEGFSSWVRFDFDATTLSGAKLWTGARGYACSDCCEGGPDGETQLMSNDASIVPPLSARELKYQCNGTHPPCKLHWYPGKNCYKLTEVNFSAGVPGYVARADKLGYRTVAGPSGTTANILQYALMLGFTEEEMVLIRLTMAAWMLCTNDHSVYEIMLGAAPYMPPQAQIVQDLDDLGRIMPSDILAGTTSFKKSEVWAGVAKQFDTPVGKKILGALGAKQAAYMKTLLGN